MGKLPTSAASLALQAAPPGHPRPWIGNTLVLNMHVKKNGPHQTRALRQPTVPGPKSPSEMAKKRMENTKDAKKGYGVAGGAGSLLRHPKGDHRLPSTTMGHNDDYRRKPRYRSHGILRHGCMHEIILRLPKVEVGRERSMDPEDQLPDFSLDQDDTIDLVES